MSECARLLRGRCPPHKRRRVRSPTEFVHPDTLTAAGLHEKLLVSFPTLEAPSMTLLLRRALALAVTSIALPLFVGTNAAAETVDSSSADAATIDASGAKYAALARECAYSTRIVAVLDDDPTTSRGFDA